MFVKLSLFFFVLTFFSVAFSAQPAPSTQFVALCYHDISTGFVGNSFSLRKKDLVTQFNYLKAHYNVVSLQELRDASVGKKEIPQKAVLLTFDDGLESFYENVFPLLKEYKFKAVFAVVGKWIDDGQAPDYGFKDSNPKMTTWAQLKEMSDSGLVEVVSHSYNLHQGQVFNPQGNQGAMAGYLKYDSTTKKYQTDSEFSETVLTDLKKNNELLKKHLGKDNTVMVWPYGKSNGLSNKAAEQAGISIQMSLGPGLNSIHNLTDIGRGLMMSYIDSNQFAAALEQAFVDPAPVRMIRVDLDGLWQKDEDRTEQHLGDLLESILALSPNFALVQAMSSSGDAYFVNSKFKMRGDYFSRAAHTIKNRARVTYVYARLPQTFLKNPEKAKAALIDLAKYTDIDGVFFEVPAKESLNENLFASLITAGRSIRPHLKFGLIGHTPPKTGLFDEVILTPQMLEKDKSLWSGSQKPPARLIVALPKDYKMQASHQLALGHGNLYLDVNFRNFTADADFKSIFYVEQNPPQHTKGEAK